MSIQKNSKMLLLCDCLSSDLTNYTYVCNPKGMKRRELEKQLKNQGWSFVRHGGRHDIWARGEDEIPVPRHAEINELTAKGILKQAKEKKA